MIIRRLLLAIATLALAACVSTTIRDSWYDTDYKAGPLKRILVLGVSSNLAERRTFEDIMVARLVAAGVEALPAYRYLGDGSKATEASLETAVRASGADGLLMSRVRNIDRRVLSQTVMAPAAPMRMGYYGWYSGWYPVTEVTQYEIAIVETSVFATASKTLVWTGETETYQPTSVRQDAPGLADVIVKALQSRGVLPPHK